MIERAIVTAVLLVGACAKNVPLNEQDAMANDPRCPATFAAPPGQSCPVNGLVCEYADVCGHDTITCENNVWNVVACTATGKHCPCLTKDDCDSDATSCVAGVCQTGTLPACGAIGGACCGGFCGTCSGGATCIDSICELVAVGGTIGEGCTLQCDGSSNCDPGEYCPDSCLTCPCTDTCREQGAICTIGDDSTCNGDSQVVANLGHCVASQGPYATTCTCINGGVQDPLAGGKCNLMMSHGRFSAPASSNALRNLRDTFHTSQLPPVFSSTHGVYA